MLCFGSTNQTSEATNGSTSPYLESLQETPTTTRFPGLEDAALQDQEVGLLGPGIRVSHEATRGIDEQGPILLCRGQHCSACRWPALGETPTPAEDLPSSQLP